MIRNLCCARNVFSCSRPALSVPNLSLRVKFPSAQHVNVEVESDGLVRDLTWQVAAALRAWPEALKLRVAERTLDNADMPLRELALSDGATVEVQRVLPDVKVERRDRALSNARFEIRKKPRWFEKILDKTVRDKWSSEIVPHFTNPEVDGPFAFDEAGSVAVMLADLAKEARLVRNGQPKRTLPPWCMRANDAMMPEGFAERLDTALEVFRRTPDWHPGSNNQVLDLVHPSLYCHVHQDVPAEGEISRHVRDRPRSHYQWLPAEFDVVGPAAVRQASYINNVDPALHGPHVESVLVEALGRFLPLWRTVRDPSRSVQIRRKRLPVLTADEEAEALAVEAEVLDVLRDDTEDEYPVLRREPKPREPSEQLVGWIDMATQDLPVRSDAFREAVRKAVAKWDLGGVVHAMAAKQGLVGGGSSSSSSPPDGLADADAATAYIVRVAETDCDDEYRRRVCELVNRCGEEEFWARVLRDMRKEAAQRKADELAAREHDRCATLKLENGRIQVIVKAADILLTPEQPVYPGGTWHLEGVADENIVATGIYYYSQDNVTPSHLEFRDIVSQEDFEYDQCEHAHIFIRYRAENGDQCNRWLGEVSTPEGRCIAFPNDLQHRAAPFQLVDPTRPGHRKMLVFFLVDPAKPILSTATVPRQQGVRPHEEALANRLALMDTRKHFRAATNSDYEEEISLCEH
eukprot:TRINITY_DN11650_c0_g1_i1.p1 TRINITY_DN11650_c0_g1~~TRINITY_DN11650_c0_g1_i1.p1  ORF type:complete len:691 (-),score=114.05 TRINITY_DN11650_c0_g1_i1:1944-4016(-)